MEGHGDRQMANDIYFGNGTNKQPAPPAQGNSRGAAPGARQPITRDPAASDTVYTRGAPSVNRTVAGSRAPGIPFSAPAGRRQANAGAEALITEQIDSELLHRAPTQMLFNYIDTEDGYATEDRQTHDG